MIGDYENLLPDEDVHVPCDTCGQRSYVFTFLIGGLMLSHCGHHHNEYREKLLAIADATVDRRYLLERGR